MNPRGALQYLLLAALVAGVSLFAQTPVGIAAEPFLRIGIDKNIQRGVIHSKGTFTFVDAGGKRATERGSAAISLTGTNRLMVGNTSLSLPVKVYGKQPLEWENHPYRGSLKLIRRSGGLTLINALPIESYLRGVLKMEVNPSWPMAALEAQAIVARTYALKHLHRHEEEGFDLCAKPHCQAYRGVNAEDPRLDRAINRTRGQVVTYNGKLALTVFHADSGGVTADVSNVWGGSYPYLVAREEPIDYQSKHSDWSARISRAQLQKALRKLGVSVGTVQSMTPHRSTPGGRVHTVRISGTAGSTEVSAHRLRMALGSKVMRSTVFTVHGDSPDTPAPPQGNAPEGDGALQAALNADEADEDLLITLTRQGHFTTEELMDMLVHPQKRSDYLLRELSNSRQNGAETTSSVRTGGGASDTFVLRGKGWGHGVGLSQWGAKSLADHGWSTRRILQHYFPGTEITRY
ncbi:MAG: SpoIID/LytB domain-containing protein [Synergistales bacterium]|nr:SpoIID/LytB domain-containing protein [Synergistales bacterium]